MATDDAVRTLTKQISEIREELKMQTERVVKVKRQNMFDDFKFYVIAFVCLFFLYILIANTVRTIRLYLKNKKIEREEEMRRRAPDDNQYEPEYTINANISKKYRSSVSRARENQNKELHAAKLEKNAASQVYKTDRQIRDSPLEADINMNVLDRSQDEYEYAESKKKTRSRTGTCCSPLRKSDAGLMFFRICTKKICLIFKANDNIRVRVQHFHIVNTPSSTNQPNQYWHQLALRDSAQRVRWAER